MQKIHKLTKEVINCIAAGEVIENPASVVKELTENAIDAGATNVTIDIKGGGFAEIQVTDNGSGIAKHDITPMFERHATSKLSNLDDFKTLNTMGFRGEALSSIASISKVHLRTATDANTGTESAIEDQKALYTRNTSYPKGTQITVRSLFYNVPARKKFQKSTSQATADITRTVMRLSAAHPDLKIKLFSQGKTLWETNSPEDLKKELQLTNGYEVQHTSLNYKVTGYLGDPLQARRNRSGQYIIVNNRTIYSGLISRALQDGYGMRLGPQTYPHCLLYLDIPPHELDVNVHPQKREVRFQEEDFVYQLVKDAVSDALTPMPFLNTCTEIREGLELDKVSFPTWSLPDPDETLQEDNPVKPMIENKDRIVGIYQHYLFIDKEDLLIMDCERAERRILHDQWHNETHTFEKEALLLPIKIQLTTAEIEQLILHQQDWDRKGIEFERTQPTEIQITALSSWICEESIKDLLLSGIQENINLLPYIKRRGGQYTYAEGVALHHTLGKSTDPKRCPQGRPIYRTLTKEEVASLS